ncbi:FkbM family methyltransferase [Gilvimarinus sp. 1_MG-2023]|uniref:FkbM family methyltransferase n=1 Tax=Gilvimarinus sp. 1_MG-2023 TaxID=3062638 RepID=UPI0026E3025A|nr:FkbM family methyltransferase [Gilvimarinus sp. 1_MG-2023]MDO6746305.1 FkbM family methyltransferase [Gilvimarinus sp. 1_MG-2023]
MISYAQNYEDVILERIFKSVKQGFYVDIGACHPVYDSVTHHFYLKDWHGINIEPQPELFSELQHNRPRDTNLNVCIGSVNSKQNLYITSDVGTTTLDPTLAKSYQSSGKVIDEIVVSVITLNDLWRNNVGARQVEFLKIDVEGLEAEILKSADFSLVTPQIIIIEAVHPETLNPTESGWEHYLKDHYIFFYFDGLNRFYRRINFHIDEKYCSTPPNIFDNFKTHKEHLLQQANSHLKEQRKSDLSRIKKLKNRLLRHQPKTEKLKNKLLARISKIIAKLRLQR